MAEAPNGTAATSPKQVEVSSLSSASTTAAVAGYSYHLFAEKLVPVLVDLFLQAPSVEKYNIYPEIVQGLGR